MGEWKKYFSAAALLFWMGVIFLLSAQPGLGVRGEPTIWFYIERKGAHIFEFFVLAALAWKTFSLFLPRVKMELIMAVVAPFSMLYALFDELHQTFVFGREGKLSDALIDGIGVSFFIFCFFVWSRYKLLRDHSPSHLP